MPNQLSNEDIMKMFINKNLSGERGASHCHRVFNFSSEDKEKQLAVEGGVANPKQTNFPFPVREGDKGDGFIKIPSLFSWINIC